MGKRNSKGISGTDGKTRILATLSPPKPDMHGVMNLIENVNSAASAIVGLAKTLQELDAAKHDSRDGLLDWYAGPGGYHSGAMQNAIELLADGISSDIMKVEEHLKPNATESQNG